MAIIDCMMNLSLLFWASEVTGNPFYREVAVRHSDTVMKYFVREDGTVYHAYRFDPKSAGRWEGKTTAATGKNPVGPEVLPGPYMDLQTAISTPGMRNIWICRNESVRSS